MIFPYFLATVGKKGICPVLPTIIPLCAADVHECFMDYDCVKDMKCCSNGCYRVCVPPADDNDTSPVAAAGNAWKNYFKGPVSLQ